MMDIRHVVVICEAIRFIGVMGRAQNIQSNKMRVLDCYPHFHIWDAVDYCFEKCMKLRCLMVLPAGLIFFDSDGVGVSRVTVRTRAANNRNASVWYRVPEGYREIPGRK